METIVTLAFGLIMMLTLLIFFLFLGLVRLAAHLFPEDEDYFDERKDNNYR